MGSIMDCRYWVCPHCCRQFDWNKDEPQKHDRARCKAQNQPETLPTPKKKKEKPPMGIASSVRGGA